MRAVDLPARGCQTAAMEPDKSSLKAILWMAASIVLFLIMAVAGRALTTHLNVLQVLEMRSVIGFLLLMPLVHRAGGLPAMKTNYPWKHIGRNCVHYSGQGLWLYGLTLIPLAQLISLEFTAPIWLAFLAVIFLGEKLNAAKIAAVALGVVGVAIIVRPGTATLDPGHLVALGSALMFSMSVVFTKSLTRTDSVVRIIFWMLVIQSILGFVPALLVWQNPPVEVWPWILVIAFTGAFSHFCQARALANADATVIMPLDFLRVPLSAVIGWALYSEQIDMFTAGGAVLILLGNLLNLKRQTAKAEAMPTP